MTTMARKDMVEVEGGSSCGSSLLRGTLLGLLGAATGNIGLAAFGGTLIAYDCLL